MVERYCSGADRKIKGCGLLVHFQIQPSLLALVLVQATGFILEVLLSVIQGVATLRRRFCCYPDQVRTERVTV